MDNILQNRHVLNKGLSIFGRHDPNDICVNPLFEQAKNNNLEAATTLVNSLWTEQKTQELRDLILPDRPPIFMTVPSTSRRNQLPIAYARLLAQQTEDLGGRYIVSDEYIAPLHTSMMKSLKKQDRLMCPRIYEPLQEDFFETFKEKTQNTQIILVEDIITTGASLSAFWRCLEHNGVHVDCVVGIKGNPQLSSPDHELKKLERTALKAGLDTLNINWIALGNELSSSEVVTLSAQYIGLTYKQADKKTQLLMRRQLYYLNALKVDHRPEVSSKLGRLAFLLKHKEKSHD